MNTVGFVLVLASAVATASPLTVWPVQGAILRGFDGGESPYSSGHRGIDIAAPVGTPVQAAGPGTVAFAGKVAGSLYVSIDHPGGLRTTASWLSRLDVRAGDLVDAGQVIGASGWGHAGTVLPHVHFSVRVGGIYVDPLAYLPALDLSELIRLVPIRGP